LPSGNQKRVHRDPEQRGGRIICDIGTQLWTCCQLSCQLAISEHCFTYENGGKGIRTPDFQLAKLALYQLSYAPGAEFSNVDCRLWIARE
jgi:hypothetical protein